VRLSVLLGDGLCKRRTLLRRVLPGGEQRRRLLRGTLSMSAHSERARRRAAHVWAERHSFELEAAQRFAWLAIEFDAVGASPTVRRLAARAADDERRHAALCATLSRHFGEAVVRSGQPVVRRVAPSGLERKDALIYDVVALACVTETLSTALLGALVDRASDSLARRAMHSILRDEVSHSRLGWAYLAEAASARAMEAVSSHLPAMLRSTLSDELFSCASIDPLEGELAGLGQLERVERRRIVRETLEKVVFPGLERFGADVLSGREWIEGRHARRLLRASAVAV
jgi:hypothetical protein